MPQAEDYPTKGALRAIRGWRLYEGDSWHGLMRYVREFWNYADIGYFRQEGSMYYLSTAGWSGNEEIIKALQKNYTFWIMCWVSSRRGGHYEFEIPPVG